MIDFSFGRKESKGYDARAGFRDRDCKPDAVYADKQWKYDYGQSLKDQRAEERDACGDSSVIRAVKNPDANILKPASRKEDANR